MLIVPVPLLQYLMLTDFKTISGLGIIHINAITIWMNSANAEIVVLSENWQTFHMMGILDQLVPSDLVIK